MNAVVFDLWQTLVAWPGEESERLRRSWASGFGVSLERLDEHWYGNPDAYRMRETGPLAPALFALCDALGGGVSVEKLFADRLELTRRALVATSSSAKLCPSTLPIVSSSETGPATSSGVRRPWA